MLLYLIIAWIYSRTLPEGKRNLMMLPADFGIEGLEVVEGSLHTMEEVLLTSMQMEMYALSRCGDEDRANMVALAFEEMTKNILIHGFCDGKKHSVDYRILKKGDDFILRLRDDCPSFNPVAKLNDMDACGDTAHMGIRITRTIARDVSYIKIMNMNNLIITI